MNAQPAPKASAAAWGKLLGLACLGVAAMISNALGVASDAYQGFVLPAAGGYTVPPQELVFWVWYLTYGLAFVGLFAFGLEQLGAAAPLHSFFERARRWKGWPVALPPLAGATSVAVRLWVLRGEVVSDDENAYLFGARTLLHGRVINPLPPQPEFFENQWIVFNSQGWFGKYPIGHPLLLALGIATHSLDVLLPALGAVTAWLTWKLGRAVLGPRRALVALVLVVLSPHFTWTHATVLSQPSSCFALLLASMAVAGRKTPARLRWLAGAALGFGLLARPLPVVLFTPVVMLHLLRGDWAQPWSKRIAGQLPVVIPSVLAVGVLMAVNAAQAGSPLESGYQGYHGSFGFFGVSLPSQVGQSIFAATLRENFWLFGWPLSLLPVFFARPKRGQLLLWGPLVGQLIYRVVQPKTVVSTTGPTYVMETVPMLALLAADGLARLRLLLARWWGNDKARTRITVAVVCSFIAAVALWTPVVAASVARGADARAVVFELLSQQGATRAVVFTEVVVEPRSYVTWAYYPQSPDPSLEQPVLVLRWPKKKGPADVVAFWQAHFKDRRAFHFIPGAEPKLLELQPVPTGN